MDGVLSDFEKRYLELFDESCMEAREKKKMKHVDGYKHFRDHWIEFINNWHFATLDWFPKGKELLQFVEGLKKVEVRILTSSGGDEFHNDVSKQKIKWLQDRFIDIPAIVVPGKRFKKLYATSYSLLVDDTEKNVEGFIENGGNAILYTPDRFDETLEKIEDFANG